MVGEIIEAVKNVLLELGPLGMVVIAMLDSSLLSIPEINDIIVVTRVIHDPRAVIHWPFLAAFGSLIGCLILYTIARFGGDAFLRRFFSAKKVNAVERFYARYGVFALIVPALWPPPLPFKIFVATAGALRFPRTKFILTIMLARSARYYTEGILAAIYGRAVLDFIKEHVLLIAALIILAIAASYGLYRFVNARLESDREPSTASLKKLL